jgi:hypothetical protein
MLCLAPRAAAPDFAALDFRSNATSHQGWVQVTVEMDPQVIDDRARAFLSARSSLPPAAIPTDSARFPARSWDMSALLFPPCEQLARRRRPPIGRPA